MWVDFIEMFSGAGGFRLGLEKASSRRLLQGKEKKSLRRGCTKSTEGKTRIEGRGGKKTSEECVSPQQGNGNLQRKRDAQSKNTPSTFTCVWANDNDRAACKIYHYRFGYKELVEADIRTVDVDSIPNHTLLTAGFPCQAFSVAGPRKGFGDTRGTLFHEICRVAEAKRPPLLLLENVKGLLSAKAAIGTGIYKATQGEGKGELTGDIRRVKKEPRRGWEEVTTPIGNGYCLYTILEALQKLGYALEYQCFNSKYFGVPQNRERVFIVGHLGKRGGSKIFPIGESNPVATRQGRQEKVAPTLRYNYFKHQEPFIDLVQDSGSEMARVYDSKGLAPTLHCKTGGWQEPKIMSNTVRSGGRGSLDRHNWDTVVVVDRTRSYAEKGRNLESPKDVTNALSGVQKDNLVIANAVDRDGYLRFGERPRDKQGKPQLLPIGHRRIRRLTPRECERLQGFPDDWTKGVSDTERYQLMGNAVTVNVIQFLGERLVWCLK